MAHIQKLITGSILIIAGILFLAWLFRCSGFDGHLVTIGDYESKEAGLRAAIPVLAKEICYCPQGTEIYRIIWKGPDPEEGQSINNHALLYIPARKRLGYEADILSGFSDRVYVVDKAAIKKVAEKGGGIEDFSEYDQDKESSR
jgi:hypothetical protein